MNIRGLLGATAAPPVKPKEKVERGIRSDESHDRDPNGQQAFGQNKGQQDHGPMSDEQLQKAVEHLQQLAAVKDNHWLVQLAEIDGRKFVLVKDGLGAIIRKIPEQDLWVLPLFEDARKGNLFKRTA